MNTKTIGELLAEDGKPEDLGYATPVKPSPVDEARIASPRALLERAAKEATTDEERLSLEKAAAELTRSAARRTRQREASRRREERWRAECNRSSEARKRREETRQQGNPLTLTIERTHLVADFSNFALGELRVWKGTTKNGTKVALAVASVAISQDPEVAEELPEWLVSSMHGYSPGGPEILSDFDEDETR